MNTPLLPQSLKLETLRAVELEVSLIVYRNEYTPSVDATAVSTHTFNSCGCFFLLLESCNVENRPEAERFCQLFISQHAL